MYHAEDLQPENLEQEQSSEAAREHGKLSVLRINSPRPFPLLLLCLVIMSTGPSALSLSLWLSNA
jgi:hypothetical protein